VATPTIKLCLEKRAPKSAFELAVANFWPQHKTLRVHFLGGSDKVRDKVKQYASVWHDHMNVRFDFVDDPKAEVRVAFVPDGSSWSALGTECLRADLFPNQTMNLGWLTDDTEDDEFSRVVTHEFGHALGCIHEHQNPDADIPWNTDAVYRYYAETQNWDKATVDQNMFRKWADTLHSTFDKESIMLYAVPKELTIGGYEVGWNRHLSEKDKAYIGTVYPPAAPAKV
jgi:astacin (peptidase family M12A)